MVNGLGWSSKDMMKRAASDPSMWSDQSSQKDMGRAEAWVDLEWGSAVRNRKAQAEVEEDQEPTSEAKDPTGQVDVPVDPKWARDQKALLQAGVQRNPDWANEGRTRMVLVPAAVQVDLNSAMT
jgi:hypothetical protein